MTDSSTGEGIRHEREDFMKRALVLVLAVLFVLTGSATALDPSDFPLEAKVIDVSQTDIGAISKTKKGLFCGNSDSPLCAQRSRVVTTTRHAYVLSVQIGDKIYEAEAPLVSHFLLEIGDYKAKVQGAYLTLLSTNAKGDLKAYKLKIVGVHQ
jgi:hypothetical protein